MSDDLSPPQTAADARDALLVALQELLLEQNATALTVRDVTSQAGMVQANFYKYYPHLEALLEDFSALLFMAHAEVVARFAPLTDSIAAHFALITRQTLRFVPASPGYGRLLFDVGLPVDRFLFYLRNAMRGDVEAGTERGEFTVENIDVAVSMITGAMLGISLDLHRLMLPEAAIDLVTAKLLTGLGVPAKLAQRLAFTKADFLPSAPLPLRWQDLQMPAPRLG